MVTYSGIGSYSNSNIFSFSASFTASVGGEKKLKGEEKQKIYFLSISDKPQVIGSLFSNAVGYVGEQLGSELVSKESEQLSDSKVASSALFFNGRLNSLYNLGATQYIIGGNSIKELKTETLLDNGWIVVSSSELSKEDFKLIQEKVKEGITPRYLTEYVLRTNPMLKAITVAAINAKLVNYDFLEGSPFFSYYSHPGKVRSNNEDAYFVGSFDLSVDNKRSRYQVLCVADGAGGHMHGEVASKEAILWVFSQIGKAIIEGNLENNVSNTLHQIISSLNERILELKSRRVSNMASTLSVALVAGEDVCIGHVGDSRIYVIDTNNERIIQLTKDHKYVEELVDKGVITREEAKVHPQRNIITSAIGMNNPRIDIIHLNKELSRSKKLIVCSDGLSDLVDDTEIYRVASNTQSLKNKAKKLVELANQRGGLDNISVVTLEYLKSSA
jgi:protein phosphatase